ncbi:FAST kinase domain-containing protein 4-like [Sphaerodactylus townsendi]|uniref:FAST kinase domain-containing protein 4-like n=1 Tax=Sphaerodactylus townsendi TaxID=933632 RepID=UPI0020266AC1|nr:FAST kinase domain-containing protein 4-like [Sphaerodactylus townsendi]
MAAKLMQRCYRLFSVSSPLCIHTNAMCAGSKMVISRAPSQIPFASLRVPSFIVRTDQLSVPEHVNRIPYNRGEVEDLIDSAATVEDLLHYSELHPVNANQAALIISRLSRMVMEQKLEPGSVLEDARFRCLLQTVHAEVSHVWNMALVNLLKSLSLLGLEQNQLRSVEQEVRWRLRRFPFKQLASLADHLAAGAHGGRPSDLMSDLLKHLGLRWTEIEDPRTLVTLMAKVGAFSPALMDRLEDKVKAGGGGEHSRWVWEEVSRGIP